MIQKIATIILRKYHVHVCRQQLKNAECDLETISIGPEQPFHFVFKHPENLRIGAHTAINGDCFINALGGVTIGHHCHLAKGLTIYSHNHNYRSASHIPYDETIIKKAVTIGDAVWIGANVTVAPGALIGNGAIISMGSVVFGTVPEGAIVRGNPAIVIGTRDMAVFKRIAAEGKFF